MFEFWNKEDKTMPIENLSPDILLGLASFFERIYFQNSYLSKSIENLDENIVQVHMMRCQDNHINIW